MTFVAPRKGATLRPIVEAAFGYSINDDPATWQWTDITKYAQLNDGSPAALSAGAQDQGQDADPAQISIMLANTDGRFTALNPASPYWPNVVRNVPLRVSVTWDGASGVYELLTAFVNGWPIRPNAGVLNVTVPLVATGRLRRLRAKTAQVVSALRKSVPAYAPVRAYWPLENGDLQSPTNGVADARAGGSSVWQSADGLPGSDTLPVFAADSTLTGDIPGTFTTTGWSVDWYMLFPSAPANPATVMQMQTTAALGISNFKVTVSASAITVTTVDQGGITTTYVTATPTDLFGSWQHMRLQLNRPSATLTAELDWIGVESGTSHSASNSTGTLNIGTPTSWTIVRDVDLAGVQFGHVYVSDGVGNTAVDGAGDGWDGELAPDRVTRVCAENNLPVTVAAGVVAAQAMGPQTIDTVSNILDGCAKVDNGLLHDAGPLGNLVYVSGAARYNAAVAFALNYLQRQIGDGLAATYDDSQLATQWTVSRPGGGSATYTDTTSTDDYGKSDTVNAATDVQLYEIASWRVGLGTVDAYRIPSISVDIRNRSPELAQAMTSLALPAHVSPTNLPSPYPPQSFDQFVEGWSATVDAVTWQVDFNCSPYAPWRVFVLQDGTLGRLDTAGSSLQLPATSAATSLPVLTGRPPQWTTAGGDMPFDISVGGEQCTVTAVAASATPTTRVGAFIEQSALGASDWTTGLANFTAVTGITVPVTRVYFAAGSFPTNNTNLNQMVAGGVRVCITLRPDVSPLNPAHLAGIDTMLSFYKAAGADLRITLNHEPFFGGISAADYVAHVRYYGPTVRKYYPLWACFSGNDAIESNGYYPGDGQVDGIAVDAYCPNSNAQTFINNAQAMADNHGLPLALWEFNGGTDLGLNPVSAGQSPADIGACFTFIQTLFTARIAAGKPNGDIILFSAGGGTTGTENFFGWSGSQQGGFEGGNGTWIASSNCTTANTAVQFRSGGHSFQLTSVAAGNMSAISCSSGQVTTGSGLPCVAGQHVIASAFFRAATVARNCHLTVAFHDSSGAALSSLSGADVLNSTTDFNTRVTCDVVAPASAAFARLSPVVVSTAAGGEVHYVDDPEIAAIGTLDHTSPIQYPWDFRIAAQATLKTALDSTSFPQTMTVTRAVNGVVRAHSAGTAISLWQPIVLAL